MQIAYTAYQLEMNNPFTIARYSRTSTPVMLLRLTYQNVHGYGEASMVPYMGENIKSATDFLKKLDLSRITYPFNFDEVVQYLDNVAPGLPAIKASVEIALNDLSGKLQEQPCYKIYHADPALMPLTSYTIGIDTPEVVRQKVADAKGFKVLKIKLGRDSDKELIDTIRTVSDLPLFIDANQGWKDKAKAIDMIYWLHDQGALLVEQPMDKDDLNGNAWITARSPIPILADEAFQRIGDLPTLKGAYHGINIKLMKSAGMHEAHKAILQARNLGMKILIGSMSETSCATLAGISLAPLCDWADLDGPWLTKNNPFKMPEMLEGRFRLHNLPGLGLQGIPESLFTS